VRVLFDQGTPVPLRTHFDSHQIETVFERGWSTLKNGALPNLAQQEGFEVLVSTDRNLRYQQNLAGRKIAIVVLSSTSWPRIQKALMAVKDGIDTAMPGTIKEVQIP
jgi:hypothetical protein